MAGRSIALLLLASCLLAAQAPPQEAGKTPSWMVADAQRKLVKLDIIAGFNANNGALNYNGYYTGSMRVIVPLGWTVEIAFHNHDGMLPHSLLVTRPFTPDEMPVLAGVNQLAISHAYTINPEQGIFAPKTDTVSFQAKPAGEDYFFCGAPNHGRGGMWTRLTIDPAAAAPSVAVAANAEPGRP